MKKKRSIPDVLFGSTRREILGLLFGQPGESYYLRQIARRVGAGQGAVQRELKRLSDGGILVRTRRGREVYYQANARCPVFEEIAGLMSKTAGLADKLRGALEPLSGRIVAAFIFGSFAKGRQMSSSDVDVMVIGEVSFSDVCDVLSGVQERIGREVNPTVYPVEEYRRKLIDRHHFLTEVMRGEKIFLFGEERELERLGKERLAD